MNSIVMNNLLRPRVTVIVYTSDNAAALRYAIESVLWQSFKNFEVWVIGNCCSDYSEDIVNSYGDQRLFWFDIPFKTDKEVRLILEGVRRARGEYIAYLNDNDIWLPNHLEVLVDSIENSEADAVFSITQYVHSSDYSTLNIPILPGLQVPPAHSSLMHKKNCVTITVPDSDQSPDYLNEFLRLASSEQLRLDVAPVTTGLKFLRNDRSQVEIDRFYFMERLKKDPDFMNKELSAILLRTEKVRQISAQTNSWMNRLSAPLQKIMGRLVAGVKSNAGIRILRRRFQDTKSVSPVMSSGNAKRNVELMTKSAKVV
jgi:glycosyltransferase involved in cell wall biosynthesis